MGRAEELDAINKALEIMNSDDVKGSGDKHLPSLAQRAVALVQLRNGMSAEAGELLQARVASFLADRAKAYNSRLLTLASQGVAANPFVKVKKMIKDMISKLVQEQTEETEHKGWCDTELTTNKQARDQKTEAVEELTAEKEDQETLIAQLTQAIEDLTKESLELAKAMAEATAERQASHETNEATVADAKAAQVAVEQATAVMKDFYAKSAQATALVQQSPGAAQRPLVPRRLLTSGHGEVHNPGALALLENRFLGLLDHGTLHLLDLTRDAGHIGSWRLPRHKAWASICAGGSAFFALEEGEQPNLWRFP